MPPAYSSSEKTEKGKKEARLQEPSKNKEELAENPWEEDRGDRRNKKQSLKKELGGKGEREVGKKKKLRGTKLRALRWGAVKGGLSVPAPEKTKSDTGGAPKKKKKVKPSHTRSASRFP